MNVWLVTIGSSDVQIKEADIWEDWYSKIKRSLYGIDRGKLAPTRLNDDDGVPYRIAARVLGIAYDKSGEAVTSQLEFPLLKAFQQQLETHQVSIDQIIVLLSDQSEVFDEDDRESARCPYWQDTCLLYPLLAAHLQTQFPSAQVSQLLLKPTAKTAGLDNWNEVLKLVQRQISSLELEPETVYVSHQAGTPAISSAVQFSSLAKFGDRIRFLVSNEYESDRTGFVESSSYLHGIQVEQAKKLLDRHDYSGIQALIEACMKDDDTRILLKAAIQWNFAKFDEFKNKLQELSDQEFAQEVVERSQNWWWVAYEEIYLARIRRNQGNVVEAFFHSFRAFEGIFAAWGKHQFGEYVECIKGIPYLKPLILDDAENYFSSKRCKEVSDLKNLKIKLENLRTKSPEEELKSDDRVELNMATLCKLFRAYRYKEYKRDCGELKIFWDNDKENNVSEKRNFIVHQIQGMSETNLWDFWGVSTPEEWEYRLLKFLNFIAKEDLLKQFDSLEEASLMVKVHQKLGEAIAQL